MGKKLGIIALESARSQGERINEILSTWRGGENFLALKNLTVPMPRAALIGFLPRT